MGALHPSIEKLAASNRYAFAFTSDRYRTLAPFHQEARAKLFELLLYNPPRVDPAPEILERVDLGNVIREKLVFSTGPDFRVPAYVHLPKNRAGRLPAIVDLHSHGGMFYYGKEKVTDFGDNPPPLALYHEQNYDRRPTATELARRGYVVITIDAFMFGERRALGLEQSNLSLDEVRTLNRACAAKESTIVKSLTFAGLTWPGIVFWDDIRTVDYLATRPEVDPTRIGCCGISMGGYRSLFLAALDPRIRAACVAGFMSTTRPMLRSHIDTHSFVHYLPHLHRYLDWPDVATLTAPRALMVLQCSRDGLFPLAGMQDAVARIAAGYKKAGCPELFSGRFYDVPHRFTLAMQDDAFAWFDRHLRA
jgi:dienelactone hydrolase